MSDFEGRPKAQATGMIQSIWSQTGTPQNPVDWSDPDSWIPERLSGDHAELAKRIWEESDGAVNPRHIYGAYLFINSFALLEPDSSGIYRLTALGQGFLNGDAGVIQKLDDEEGLLQLLLILSTKGQARRGELLDEWGEFLLTHSKFGTASTIKDTLRRRLLNLVERGLVSRDGNRYGITQAGLDYVIKSKMVSDDPRKKVMRAVKSFNDAQVEALRERLGHVPPVAFEHLVRDLLEAMGYEDVTVTKESGDKGVDVVATVQFGITTITEVVQVKRHQGSIGRPILDQLRGALPLHRALRGTIISLGAFTKGCQDAALFPGAAPIGLIDGRRLLELLVEHKIGIVERPATLYEIDENYFAEPGEEPI
ncbi:MAG: restriction endonuclease [Proteobacteria bacterium]|nr:restriction endonuclease [Pseudomonadota bacterium]